LARSGASLDGVVSFHGNLDSLSPEEAKNIKAKVLVLHGAADPHVPTDQVEKFRQEMEGAAVDWQMISYGNAVHSFTMQSAGSDPSNGSAYNERAAKRSWLAMKTFLNEVFQTSR